MGDLANDPRLDTIMLMMEKLVLEQIQQVQTCGICATMGHPTNMCPTLQENSEAQVNAVGEFQGQQPRK